MRSERVERFLALTRTASALVAGASLVACATAAPQVRVEQVQQSPGEDPSWPAFAVYGLESTVLVPTRPAGEDDVAVWADGLWLLGEGEVALVQVLPPQTVPENLFCDPAHVGSASGRCPTSILTDIDPIVRVTRIDPDRGAEIARVALVDETECSCFERVSDEDLGEDVGTVEAGDGEQEGDGAAGTDDAECEYAGWPQAPVALAGGALFLAGFWDNQACSGVRVAYWDLSEVTPVARGSQPPGETPPEWQDLGCVLESPFTESWPIVALACDAGSGCTDCSDVRQSFGSVLAVVSGQLVETTLYVDTFGNSAASLRSTPITPQTCPSPADPCGPPEAFPGIDQVSEAYWIASDASSALALVEGELALYLLGVPTPFAQGSAPQPILGVRYHPDARSLRDQIGAAEVASREPVAAKSTDHPKQMRLAPRFAAGIG